MKSKSPSSWLALLICISLASAIRQCSPEDQTRDLEPGQCLTQCASKDGSVTCPGDPPVTVKQDDCDYLTVVRGSDGKVLDQCCTKNPSEPSKKRPQCGKNVGWLECDPDNGFGSCCSTDGYCGSGDAFCGHGDGGCNSECTKCPGPRKDKRCGKDFNDATCQQGECCSKNGYCGSTDNHCKVEKGCQNSCTSRTPGANRCGAQAGGRTCDPHGEFGGCCSKNGFCGTSQAHCDKTRGCQSGCEDQPSSGRTPRNTGTQKPLKPAEDPSQSKDDGKQDDPNAPKGGPTDPKAGGPGTKDSDGPGSPQKGTGDDDHRSEDPDAPKQQPRVPGSSDPSKDDPDSGKEDAKDPQDGRSKTEDPDAPKKGSDSDRSGTEDSDAPKKGSDSDRSGTEDPDAPKKGADSLLGAKDNDKDTDKAKECPPCPEVKCPACPKAECPPCPKAECPPCPQTECPPPPEKKKNPSSAPKLDSSDPSTVYSCLCDEGESATAHKIDNPRAVPQQTGCPWKHGEKVYYNNKCYKHQCYMVQTGGEIDREWGDSLEECGQICGARPEKNHCHSVNFFPSTTNARGVCRLHLGYGWNERVPTNVFGGALTRC